MTRSRRQSAPDFSWELARCDELETMYENDPRWEGQCDEWAEVVVEKIKAWDPRLIRRFLVDSVFESSAEVYMPDEAGTVSEKLIELRRRRYRLESVLFRPRRFEWISNLLRP
jgi:hypothetical protein